VQLALEGPADVPVRSPVREGDGTAVGEITSVAAAGSTTLALAYVRAELAQPGKLLAVGDRPATVRLVVGTKMPGA
jgi:hypothetical protein